MKEQCPYCKIEFEEAELDKHKFECVSSYQDYSFNFENKIPCEICQELIEFDKYNEHISICSQPTGSFPFLLDRLNTGTSDLFRILNIPSPPNVSNTSENSNSLNLLGNNEDNINSSDEINISEDNLDNSPNDENGIQQPLNLQINNSGQPNELNISVQNANTMEYNINLINYNMSLINNLLRNSQFRNDYIGDSYESLSVLDDNVVKEGLSVQKVSTIFSLEEKTKCPICLDDFDVGEKFRIIKCQHSFCDECLEDWLEENKKCPVCMIEIE